MKKIITRDNIEALIGILIIITACLLTPYFIEMAINLGVAIGERL